MNISTEVLDFIPLACCQFDRTGVLRYLNAPALKLFCKSQIDCIGKKIPDIFPAGLAEVCTSALINVLDKAVVFETDFLSPINDRWLRLTATPGISGVVMSFVDIHDLKSAEQADRQFKQFVKASFNTVYRMSSDWKNMYHLNGKNLFEENGPGIRNWMAKCIPEVDWHLVKERIAQAIVSKDIFELEHRVLKVDGTVGWVYSRAVPVFDRQNHITEWLVANNDITKRKEGEKALRESEGRSKMSFAKYLSLFNTIDQGFCVIKVLFDDSQKASDYQFLEVNPAFEAQTGLKNIIGENMRDLAPDHEEHWFRNYGKVALTGIPIRFEAEAIALKRWFDVYAFAIDEPEEHHVALLFNDITTRKELEDRQFFLLKLSDALRPLSDSDAIMSVAMNLLVEHLGLEQAQFYEVESYDGFLIASDGYTLEIELPMKVKVEDFEVSAKKLFCAGKTIAIKDASNGQDIFIDGKSEFQSLISVPIVKEGRFIASMCLYHSSAHDWSAHEIAIAEETAQRTWAAFELAKIEEALRKTELRLYTVLQQAPMAIAISDSSGEILFRNQVFDELWGRPIHDTTARLFSDFYKGFHLDGKAIASEEWPGSRAVLEGTVVDSQVLEVVRESGEHIFCAFNAAPIRDEQGSITGGVVLFRDVSEERNTAAALRISEEKYRNELEKEVVDRTRELRENYALLQTIFDTNLIGMSVFRPVWDHKGELMDFQILIVNKLIVNAIGRDDMVGKLYSELFPGVKQMGLFELMVKTFKTGIHGKMDYHYTYEGIDRWYSTMFVKGDDILVSTNLDITERIEAERKLREMVARQQQEIFQVTLNTQEQERRRVSESLHNGLGQLLYGAKLSLNSLSPITAMENTEKYIQVKHYIEDLLTEAIRETRRISHELMPTVLAEFGLKVAIKEVCDQLQNGVKFNSTVLLGNVRLDNYLELAVFRTVQELMINVVKHAKATQAIVIVNVGDKDVRIQVKDNGQGMPDGRDGNGGIGLSSIRNKVELLKGIISINCKPAKGTSVDVRFPIFKANSI